ncbi:suppressor of cytokine signaling 1a [Alosa pseudoharengus]|nr:suppressor of cytokine signaling 1a [Alosa sapidissima]XP_041943437.1 suppressor of cytokine signaling 1a [Alosa sapidissima]XP_048100770.1 suppressor of cytokine signaling 1a isoform X2 [Alosa alosa]XP_048100771.1 suppressor of cytokine signaling 1a isoform X2 [Alosa alosa]
MVAHSPLEGNTGPAECRVRIEPSVADSLAHRPRSCQQTTRRDGQTHFRPFKSEQDFKTITQTTSMLENSGFYWGPMTVEEAHHKLKSKPLGTFLIRDSRQKDVFFTLSYRASAGPISIRINYQAARFSLSGSKESFDSLFKLLEYYITSPKKSLTRPCRKVQVQSLQELCRRTIVEACGEQPDIDSIPVNPILKDFLHSFPYRL